MRPVSTLRRPVVVLSAITLAAALAGCASSRTGGAAGDTPTANGAISTGITQPSGELVRVSGTVVSGEEPGCLLLDTGFTTYVLLGGDQAALALAEEDEEPITVTGQAHTPTPTACTEGVPLKIEKVTPAS
jgi:hypothetical protein